MMATPVRDETRVGLWCVICGAPAERCEHFLHQYASHPSSVARRALAQRIWAAIDDKLGRPAVRENDCIAAIEHVLEDEDAKR
jgi:hypothetical protein